MIENARLQIESLIEQAYHKAAENGSLLPDQIIDARIEIPKDSKNGDFASSFALVGAKAFRKSPKMIAQILVDYMDITDSYFDSVEIAGPGFINFTLGSRWYSEVLTSIQTEGTNYGKNSSGNGKKVMVEFVSANPTGPMHIGNARGGVLGDTLANILSLNGYNTWKEFYLNDYGNQVNKFAVSINARYMQIVLGEDNFPFPEEGYHGDDIRELASAIHNEFGSSLVQLEEHERLEKLAEYGLNVNVPNMKNDLQRYGIEYDTWFYESTLHESGYVAETVDQLSASGWTYEKDGALWLNTTKLLTEKYLREGKTAEQIERLPLKDDVLRRSNGLYTYFAADIAYHRNKFETRSFDKVINIWGADHHGHVARLQAALDGLGLDGSNRLVIVLMHLVNLLKDGQPVRMSKRSGKAMALRDLLDEINVDAARYFFNSRISSSALDFDLDLAVKNDSDNPVYYIQYAHARICSLFAAMKQENSAAYANYKTTSTSVLTTDVELALIKLLSQYPEDIKIAAFDNDPSVISRYLVTLSSAFHRFYNANRIKGESDEIQAARLKLADATRIVLKNGMTLLGLSAPEKM